MLKIGDKFKCIDDNKFLLTRIGDIIIIIEKSGNDQWWLSSKKNGYKYATLSEDDIRTHFRKIVLSDKIKALKELIK
jgi:frataxin-like iron-binding protein CyaY